MRCRADLALGANVIIQVLPILPPLGPLKLDSGFEARFRLQVSKPDSGFRF